MNSEAISGCASDSSSPSPSLMELPTKGGMLTLAVSISRCQPHVGMFCSRRGAQQARATTLTGLATLQASPFVCAEPMQAPSPASGVPACGSFAQENVGGQVAWQSQLVGGGWWPRFLDARAAGTEEKCLGRWRRLDVSPAKEGDVAETWALSQYIELVGVNDTPGSIVANLRGLNARRCSCCFGGGAGAGTNLGPQGTV